MNIISSFLSSKNMIKKMALMGLLFGVYSMQHAMEQQPQEQQQVAISNLAQADSSIPAGYIKIPNFKASPDAIFSDGFIKDGTLYVDGEATESFTQSTFNQLINENKSYNQTIAIVTTIFTRKEGVKTSYHIFDAYSLNKYLFKGRYIEVPNNYVNPHNKQPISEIRYYKVSPDLSVEFMTTDKGILPNDIKTADERKELILLILAGSGRKESLNNLGVYYAGLERWNDAKKWFKKILDIDHDFLMAKHHLALVYHRKGIISYEKEKDFAAAEEYFNKSLSMNSDDQAVKNSLAVMYFERGLARHQVNDLDGAESCFLKALKFSPDFQEVKNHIAKVYTDKGRARYKADDVYAARYYWSKALKYAAIEEAQVCLSYLLNEQGITSYDAYDFDAAEEHFKEAYELNPNNSHAKNNLSSTYYCKGERCDDINDYLYYFKKAYELNPNNNHAKNGLSVAYAQKAVESYHDLDSKIYYLRKAHALNPGNTNIKGELSTAYYQQGVVKFAGNDFDGAEDCWLETLNLNPYNAVCKSNLAMLYNETGLSCSDLESAETYFRKAVAMNPESEEYEESLKEYQTNLDNLLHKKDVEAVSVRVPEIDAEIDQEQQQQQKQLQE